MDLTATSLCLDCKLLLLGEGGGESFGGSARAGEKIDFLDFLLTLFAAPLLTGLIPLDELFSG